ncbi:tape measure protein [Actinobaculum sp. 352]|uniref:tape measure protein n=1 Tax=Actinobaculum sp. 352 TaxID=2490946 RepID=UPI0013E01820|nr:tape measure protein [Actinobaculum sp. 352]
MLVGELEAVLTADTSKFDSALGKAESGLKKTATAFTTIATAGVAATGGMITSLFKVGTSYNQLQQSSRAALTTLLGSTEAANAQLAKFDDFARNSPFARDTFLVAQQQLLGFGVAAEKVIPMLSAIQDAVAATGGSNQQIADLAFVLAQVSAAGKVTGQDLLQLGQRGVDAATIIGDQMGITGEKVREMISAGKISAEDFLDYLTTGMSEKYENAAANLKDTFVGAADRVKAAWRDIGSIISAPFVDPQGGGYLTTWFNDVADNLRALQSLAEPIMTIIMTRWKRPLDEVHAKLQELAAVIRTMDAYTLTQQFDGLLGTLKQYAPVIGAVVGSMGGLITGVPILGKAFSALGLGINPVVGAMIGLTAATPEVRDGLSQVASAITPLLVAGGEITAIFAKFASDAIRTLAPALADLATAIADAGVPIAEMLVPAAQSAVDVLTPIVGVVADVVSWMSELPAPLLTAASAFIMFHGQIGKVQDILGSAFTGAFHTAKGAISDFTESLHVAKLNGIAKPVATIQAGMYGLGTAARAAGNALKTAFMSNALGLAITGLSAVISAFASENHEAKQRVDSFKDSLDDTTAAVTDQTRALVASRLSELGILDDLKEAGISQAEYTAGILREGDAHDRVTEAINKQRNAVYEMKDENGETFQVTIDRNNQIRQAYEDLSNEVQDGIEQKKIQIGFEEQLADAVYDVADANRDALVTARELADYRNQQANAAAKAMKAELDYASQLERTMEAMDGVAGASTEETYALLSLRDAAMDNVNAQAELGGSSRDMQALMQQCRDDFINAAEAAGMTRDEAEDLADKLGLIPSEVHTKVDLDVAEALQTSKTFVTDINEMEGTISINGNTVDAEQTLAEFGLQVDETTGTVTINGNEYPADMTLSQLIGKVNTSEGTVTIEGNDYPAADVLTAYIDSVNRGAGTVTINGKDYPARTVLSSLESTINETNGRVIINGDNSNAKGAVNEVQRYANQNPVTVPVKMNWTGIAANIAAGVSGLRGAGASRFADGGITEPHVAQIAPAGAWRVWAEPETGGEAYIPLANSKRDRSTAILGEVASRFGYQLIRSYADGGVNATPTVTTGGTYTAASIIATAIAAGLDGAKLSLDADGQQFNAYVAGVSEERIIAALKGRI